MEQSILTPTQKTLLGEISQYQPLTNRFYLTGGTALAEFYLQRNARLWFGRIGRLRQEQV